MAIIVPDDISFNDGSDDVDGSLLTPATPLDVGSVNASGDPTFEAGNSLNTGKGNDKLIGQMDDMSTPSNSSGNQIRIGGLLLNSLFPGE